MGLTGGGVGNTGLTGGDVGNTGGVMRGVRLQHHHGRFTEGSGVVGEMGYR